MRNLRTRLLMLATGTLLSCGAMQASAALIDLNWSLDTDAGLITGMVFGVQDDGVSAASGVSINTGIHTLGNFDSILDGTVLANSFELVAGTVVSAQLFAANFFSGFDDVLSFDNDQGLLFDALLQETFTGTLSFSQVGNGGPVGVPEPGPLALLALGLVAAGLARRQRA